MKNVQGLLWFYDYKYIWKKRENFLDFLILPPDETNFKWFYILIIILIVRYFESASDLLFLFVYILGKTLSKLGMNDLKGNKLASKWAPSCCINPGGGGGGRGGVHLQLPQLNKIPEDIERQSGACYYRLLPVNGTFLVLVNMYCMLCNPITDLRRLVL
jgi:hypothetical protein